MPHRLISLTIILGTSIAHSAVNIHSVEYDPGGHLANATLHATSGTFEFDLTTSSYTYTPSSGSTIYGSGRDFTENSLAFVSFNFESLNIDSSVIVEVTYSDTSQTPDKHLVISSQNNLTIEAEINYLGSTTNPDHSGNILLIARETLHINSIISTNGTDGSGSIKDGSNAGNIYIIANTISASNATLSADGGNAIAHNSKIRNGGNGGQIYLHSHELLAPTPIHSVEGGLGSINGADGSVGSYNVDFANVPSYISAAVPEPTSINFFAITFCLGISIRKRPLK